MVDQLDVHLKRNPERARAILADILGDRVALEPDQSGRYLWANYGIGRMPLLTEALGADSSVLMVAGA